MDIPGSSGTQVISECVGFAPIRDSPNISMLCSCPSWSTEGSAQHHPHCSTQTVEATVLWSTADHCERESSVESSAGNSILQPGQNTHHIHSWHILQDWPYCLLNHKAPCAPKEEEPEIPGNSTNNHHRRWSVPLHKWQKRKGVLKRKAQHILHYQLQRNKQKFKAKSKIPEESKETIKNQSSRSNIWISGIPRMEKENEEKEII